MKDNKPHITDLGISNIYKTALDSIRLSNHLLSIEVPGLHAH